MALAEHEEALVEAEPLVCLLDLARDLVGGADDHVGELLAVRDEPLVPEPAVLGYFIAADDNDLETLGSTFAEDAEFVMGGGFSGGSDRAAIVKFIENDRKNMGATVHTHNYTLLTFTKRRPRERRRRRAPGTRPRRDHGVRRSPEPSTTTSARRRAGRSHGESSRPSTSDGRRTWRPRSPVTCAPPGPARAPPPPTYRVSPSRTSAGGHRTGSP
ncbi:nuclear transport factor 2 family protein [Saccharomonospora sp. NPDC046836]|uniref:nuclear transport factor 2 family protein n=1 Tax=Saccharomonospora sp. NPDC046836 TaxID=3156921 RepID=UPI0033F3557F